MSLRIDRDDPARQEREAMAGQGTTAQARVYETTDGRLVKEGDPHAAFLAFAVGADVPHDRADEYDKLFAEDGPKASQAYTDDDVRAELRERQAGQPPAHIGVTPPLVGERLATELADEARRNANRPVEDRAAEAERVDPDRVVTTRALWRTEKGDLVAEGSESGATQAYAPGDVVQDADVDAYMKLDESTQDGSGKSTEDKSAAKMTTGTANKASTVSRNK